MTIDEAIRILDPETSKEALLPYAYDSHQRRKVVDEACRVAVDELRKRQWISVEDRLPENNNTVIVSDGNAVDLGFYDPVVGTWWSKQTLAAYCLDYIEYWQPMPEPPKEGEENAG